MLLKITQLIYASNKLKRRKQKGKKIEIAAYDIQQNDKLCSNFFSLIYVRHSDKIRELFGFSVMPNRRPNYSIDRTLTELFSNNSRILQTIPEFYEFFLNYFRILFFGYFFVFAPLQN